jgi:signal transduction histidine kinase
MDPEQETPRRLVPDSGPTATLDEVDILRELFTRPSAPPDYAAESRAVAILAEEIAANPANMLRRLVEVAVELCHADTAAVSLLEGEVFRWEAVAGTFAAERPRVVPRNASPSGVVIDRDAVQLMRLPDRCFPALLAEPRFVEALLVPFHDHGTPIGAVWIVSHHVDREFDREDARLLRALTQYTAAAWQLWRQSETATTHTRLKSEFLATLGHELRSPLAAIYGVNVMPRVASDQTAHRAVAVIRRQTQHLFRLVEDLIDIGRIESGKISLYIQPIDLRAVVAETIEVQAVQLGKRRQHLAVDLGTSSVVVRADFTRIAQVVSNLMDNASKYTPEGGHIRVTLRTGEGHAEVGVEDDGQGIPPEQLETIFEPFVQLQGGKGLGLGLTLVRRLAELHDGAIHVVSEGRNKGSRFTLRLPVDAKTSLMPQTAIGSS